MGSSLRGSFQQASAAIGGIRIPSVGGKRSDVDALNQSVVVELQEGGIAAPSTTRVGGNLAIRVNITNHRTRAEDLELLLREARKVGAELAAN